MAAFRAAGVAVALTEVCSNCGAVVGARAFWSFLSPGNRAYFSRCPLCGARHPWRKATPEEVTAFRHRAGSIRRGAAGSRGARFLNAFGLLLFVALVLATCFGDEGE